MSFFCFLIEIHSMQGWTVTARDGVTRKRSMKRSQGSNFLGGSFSNGDNVIARIEFRKECQPQLLKRWFFLKNRSIHFHINNTSVIRPVKQNQLHFASIEINNHFLPQSTVPHRSDSSSEDNSSYSNRSDVWSHLE